MRDIPLPRFDRIALPLVALALLPGSCRGAPSIEVAGAYFPAWLGCAATLAFATGALGGAPN